MTVIDANGLILGRLSSVVAKRLLNGETIDIINAEKAVISGSRANIFADYEHSVERGRPEYGPYFPKRPDKIMKRTVRGMLPYKRQSGRKALSNLKVYVGVPAEFQGKKTETVEDASMERLSSRKYVRLGDVSKKLGANF
ncbi:50S ribosomal protein L13 [Methanolapillus millepedarum]|uniref:Large ribosomal subunit protein uL13 n=1 Tax=Methanolapillus millepedarum TaxID=3028296 RepID=A0AA96VC57_9EURY|nr:50S ribosomal protein L13 [Methanosarcinaceae archaeon Ac7]